MELLKDISVIWSLIHTLVMFLLLFESRYPRKKTITITLAAMMPLLVVNFLLFVILGIENYGTLMLLTLSLPSCIFFWFISKYRDGRFFFTFCVVDTTVLEILYITNILNHYLTPDTYVFMFVVRLLAYPFIEILIYKKIRPMFLEVQRQGKKGWGIFATIGILFYIAITLLMTYPTPVTDRPEYLPVLAIMFLLMPVIYLHIISTLRHQQLLHESSEQDNIMKLQVSNIIARVEEFGAANEAFRKERHDFRHKLKAIASLVETEQYEELKKVVVEYKDDIEKTKVVRYSQYPIIDAVLSVYIRKAEQSGIDVKMGFAFPDTFEASETELATALANAIENAVHACVKLPPKDRHIEIKVLSKPKFMIMVRNSFAGQVEFDENGIPESREDGHGFGTRSIAAFCEKIGGHYQFKAEGTVFTLFMYLK